MATTNPASSKKLVRPYIVVLVAGCFLSLIAGFWISRREVKDDGASRHPHAPQQAIGDGAAPTTASSLVDSGLPNPQGAVEDFGRLYRALDAYRRKHRMLPPFQVLLDTSKPLVDDVRLTPEDFTVPDWHLSQWASRVRKDTPRCTYAMSFASLRPDGNPKPAFPARGERDVWLYSELSARMDSLKQPDGAHEVRFAGVYVVLFSDGSIKRFSHKQLFFVDDVNLPGDSLAFPGMTGYTKVAYTWEELYKRASRTRVTYDE